MIEILGEIQILEETLVNNDVSRSNNLIIWEKFKNFTFPSNPENIGHWQCALIENVSDMIENNWSFGKIEHFIESAKKFSFKDKVVLMGTAIQGKKIGMDKKENIFCTFSPCILPEGDITNIKFKGLHDVIGFKMLVVRRISEKDSQ